MLFGALRRAALDFGTNEKIELSEEEVSFQGRPLKARVATRTDGAFVTKYFFSDEIPLSGIFRIELTENGAPVFDGIAEIDEFGFTPEKYFPSPDEADDIADMTRVKNP